MCWPKLPRRFYDEDEIESYRVRRDSYPRPGYRDRRRSSVERHLDRAPLPRRTKNKKRYPKVYENTEELYETDREIYEYSTTNFPWDAQNRRGKVRRVMSDNSITYFDPGYVRTITDSDKTILGVNYHQSLSKKAHVRAEEIQSLKWRSSKRRRHHS